MAKVILEHDREFEFQEFCRYMADIYNFLSTRPGYSLRKESYMEGMQTKWNLYESMHNREELVREQEGLHAVRLGPTLYYSNANDRWCGIDPCANMPLKFIDEPIKRT